MPPVAGYTITMSTHRNTSQQRPCRVTLMEVDSARRIAVDGEPFFVKGAGGGFGNTDALGRHGANALRTWSTRDAGRVLEEAQKAGLMVLMGLTVIPERHGFDYDDVRAVRRQLDSLAAEVRSWKDHPALLGWGIGNELNLLATNPAVWNAVNDIAAMIHDVDGFHPATTMLAGIRKPVVDEITARAPDVDFLSVQMYGDIVNLRARIDEAGYTGPYLVTEWGATGHWEVPQTDWGAPIEQTSSEKADAVLERYRTAILGDAKNCMGSFVFLWGQKQERTPTWYGLFTERGEETEAIDVMEYVWTGSRPESRAPRLTDISVDGRGRYASVVLSPGERATARLAVEVLHGQVGVELQARAEILPEATVLGEGGDYEPRPEPVAGVIDAATAEEISFTAPVSPGPYRLFAYVTDEHNHAATANLPFLVK